MPLVYRAKSVYDLEMFGERHLKIPSHESNSFADIVKAFRRRAHNVKRDIPTGDYLVIRKPTRQEFKAKALSRKPTIIKTTLQQLLNFLYDNDLATNDSIDKLGSLAVSDLVMSSKQKANTWMDEKFYVEAKPHGRYEIYYEGASSSCWVASYTTIPPEFDVIVRAKDNKPSHKFEQKKGCKSIW